MKNRIHTESTAESSEVYYDKKYLVNSGWKYYTKEHFQNIFEFKNEDENTKIEKNYQLVQNMKLQYRNLKRHLIKFQDYIDSKYVQQNTSSVPQQQELNSENNKNQEQNNKQAQWFLIKENEDIQMNIEEIKRLSSSESSISDSNSNESNQSQSNASNVEKSQSKSQSQIQESEQNSADQNKNQNIIQSQQQQEIQSRDEQAQSIQEAGQAGLDERTFQTKIEFSAEEPQISQSFQKNPNQKSPSPGKKSDFKLPEKITSKKWNLKQTPTNNQNQDTSIHFEQSDYQQHFDILKDNVGRIPIEEVKTCRPEEYYSEKMLKNNEKTENLTKKEENYE